MKKKLLLMIVIAMLLVLAPFIYFEASALMSTPRPMPVIGNPTPPTNPPIDRFAKIPPVIRNVNTGGKKIVAITFDDGPITPNTAQFCNTLRANRAKGSFFMVGGRVSGQPNEAKIAMGCGEVENHTNSHQIMKGQSLYWQLAEVSGGRHAILQATGWYPKWLRPRGGQYDANTLIAATKNAEKIVLWNVEGADTIAPDHTARAITANVLNNVKPGSIILLHQTNPETLKALPNILWGLRVKGYGITTVTDLALTYGIW